MGWFLFVITLVPVIGIVQVGRQAMADHYAYVPCIGLFIILAWGLNDLGSAIAIPRVVPAVAVLSPASMMRPISTAGKRGCYSRVTMCAPHR